MAEPRASEGVIDPTLLTTQALLREIANLKELQASNLEVVRISLRASLDDVTKRLDHKYVETSADFQHMREFFSERIEGMRALSAQSREDNKTSLDAAFKSAKDAQDKTEQSFTKQIEALSERTEAASKATNEKIDRLTSRLDTGEGKSKGKTDGIGSVGAIAVGAAFIISTLVSVAALIVTLTHH